MCDRHVYVTVTRVGTIKRNCQTILKYNITIIIRIKGNDIRNFRPFYEKIKAVE